MGNMISIEKNKLNKSYRLHSFLSIYDKFITQRNITDSEISRLIFVEDYINSHKFNIYDDSYKKLLIRDLEKYYPFFHI